MNGRPALELLHEIVPAVTPIGFLVNPTGPAIHAHIKSGLRRILGVRLMVLREPRKIATSAISQRSELLRQKFAVGTMGQFGYFDAEGGSQ